MCPSDVLHDTSRAVGSGWSVCELPKDNQANLILVLFFPIAPSSFHTAAGKGQCKPRPAPPTKNLTYDMLKKGKIAHRTSHMWCAAQLSREMHIFALSESRTNPKAFLPWACGPHAPPASSPGRCQQQQQLRG